MSLVFHLLPVLALLFYIAASVSYLRALFSSGSSVGNSGRSLLVAGFISHLLFKLAETFNLFAPEASAQQLTQLSSPETFSLVALLATGIYLVLAFRGKVKLLGAFIAPLATILFLFSGVLFHFVSKDVVQESLPTIIYIHVINTVVALSCFLLAFGVSMAVLVQERSLKYKRFLWLSKKLPSLASLDRLNTKSVGWGVLFLLLGIIPGVLYAAQIGLENASADVRVVSSILVFIIYGLLFFFMKSYGLRGRRAALFSVAGFLAVCVSLISTIFGSGFHVY